MLDGGLGRTGLVGLDALGQQHQQGDGDADHWLGRAGGHHRRHQRRVGTFHAEGLRMVADADGQQAGSTQWK